MANWRLTAASTSMPPTAAPSAPAAPSITESPTARTPAEGATVPGRRLPPRGGGGAVGAAVPVWSDRLGGLHERRRDRRSGHPARQVLLPGLGARRIGPAAEHVGVQRAHEDVVGSARSAAGRGIRPRRGPPRSSPSKLPVSRYCSTPARSSARDGGRRSSPRWRRTTLSETPRATAGNDQRTGRGRGRRRRRSSSAVARSSIVVTTVASVVRGRRRRGRRGRGGRRRATTVGAVVVDVVTGSPGEAASASRRARARDRRDRDDRR